MGNCCAKAPVPGGGGARGGNSRKERQPDDSLVYAIQNKEDFNQHLKEAGGNLIVADFYATWCGPCKVVAPKVEEMTSQFPSVLFVKVDVDENDELASAYDVSCMPTFIFFKNELKIAEFSGANMDKLKELIASHAT